MTCPHCGAEAGGQSFCPSCARLVKSPLLEMHRELAASRGKTYGAEALAAAGATRARDIEAATGHTARAQHSAASHTIDDTSTAPPPVPARPRAATPEPVPEVFPRPLAISMLAMLNVMAGVVMLGLASALWDGERLRPLAIDTASRYLAGGVGVVHLLTALGLRGMHPFGRTLQRLLAFAGLALVPFGTVYALIVLAYLGSRGVTLLFAGRSPRSLNAQELEAVRKSLKLAPVMAIVFFVLAILPALAIASFASSDLPAIVYRAVTSF